MKKAIFILGAIAVATACSQEKEMPLVKNTFTIHAEAVAEPETKVSYSEGVNAGGNSGIHWEVGETIGLVNSDSQVESSALDSEKRIDGGNKAEFTVSATEGTYTVYHPYHAESAYNAICFDVSASQSQGITGFMDAGTKRLPLIGQAPVELSAGAVSAEVKFNVVGSLLRFFVYGGEGGEKLKKVSVSSESATLSGKMTTSNSGAIASEVANGGHSVSVTLGTAADIPAISEDAKGVYAVVIPATIAANTEGSVTYTVTTSEYVYTFVSTMARTWESGNKYDIYLNLAENTSRAPATPEKLYILGDGSEVGGWDTDKAIELTKDGDIFTKDLLMYTGKGFHFANHKNADDRTHAYMENPVTKKLEYTYKKNASDDNFTVSEGTGWYTITADFSTGTVTATRHNPYIRKLGNNVAGGYNKNNREMSPVENQPGVFYIKEKFSAKECDGFDFMFLANYVEGGDYYKYYPTQDNKQGNYSQFSDVNGVQVKIQKDGDCRWWFAPTDLGIDYEITLDTKNMTVKAEAAPEFYIIGNAFTAVWDPAFSTRVPLTRVAGQRKAEYTGNAGDKAGVGSDWKICSKYADDWGYYKGLWLFASEYQENGVPIYPESQPNAVYGVSKSLWSGSGTDDKKWRFGSEASGKTIKVTLDWSDWNSITLKCEVATE